MTSSKINFITVLINKKKKEEEELEEEEEEEKEGKTNKEIK